MQDSVIYDFLEGLLPEGLQFVDPYLDEVPLPKGDWAQMNILNIQNIGWEQRRTDSFDEEKGLVKNAWDIQRVYSIQFDFYGESAFNNSVTYQQNLRVALMEKKPLLVDLKQMGNIENRTELLENKKYLKRYGFDLDVFVVDTIYDEKPYFETIKIRIANRGNHF